MSSVLIRLLLFAGFNVLSLVVPFVLLDDATAVIFMRWSGYYFIAANFFFFCILAFLRWKPWLSGGNWKGVLRENRWGLVLVLGCAVFLQLQEPWRFKVLYDEYALYGNSLTMHHDRMVGIPGTAHYFNGVMNYGNFYVDKRPVFYSFLVSLLHDFTGERVENAFVVNGVAAFFLLLFVYIWSRWIFGFRSACLAVLLLTSLPLLAQNATGGGFDLLNAAVITGVLLLATQYVRSGKSEDQALLVLGLTLLAQCRYESIFFLLAGALTILMVWIRQRRITLPWPSVVAPIFLLSPLLSIRIFISNEEFFQLEEPTQKFFELGNIPENFGHAVYYFFSWSPDNTNSLLLSVFGFVSLVFVLLLFVRNFREIFTEPDWRLPFYLFFGLVAGNTLWALSNFWGQFDDPVVSRITLPIHVFLTLGVVLTLREFFKERPLPVWLHGFVGLFIVVFTMQANTRHFFTNDIEINRHMEWAVEFAREDATERDLFVAESSLPFIVNHRPSIADFRAKARPELLLRSMELGFYDNVYFVFRYRQKNDFSLEPRGDPSVMDDLVVEIAEEYWWRPNFVSRIYRLEGVKPDTVIEERLEGERSKTVPEDAEEDVGIILYKLKQLP